MGPQRQLMVPTRSARWRRGLEVPVPDQEEDPMDTPPGEQTSSPTDQGEPAPGARAAQPSGSAETRPKGVFPPPRKLTDDQEREVKRQ